MTAVMGFYVILFMILGLVIYHSIFDIWYFNFGKSLIGELFGAFIFGAFMTYLALKFWLISLIVIILIGIGMSAKVNNPTGKRIVIGVFVVVAIISGIVGFRFNKMNAEAEAEQKAAELKEEEELKIEEENLIEHTPVNADVHLKEWVGAEEYYDVDFKERFVAGSTYICKNDYQTNYANIRYAAENQDDNEYGTIKLTIETVYNQGYKQGSMSQVSGTFTNSVNHPLKYNQGDVHGSLEIIDENTFVLEGFNNLQDTSGYYYYEQYYNGKYVLASEEDLAILDEVQQIDTNYEEGQVNYDDTIINSKNSNEYIFPDSAERYLQEEELYGYSAQELAYARNEIYARHGCVFNSEELNNYFKSKSWYVIDELYDGSLTDIERTNAKLIAEYQVNNNLEYKPQ